MEFQERIKEIALDLTQIKSVVETSGEVAVADRIVEILESFQYFKEHPQNLYKVPIKGDALNRYAIIALLKGEATESKDTVVTLGHYDTVGTSDYGSLEEFATQPLKLAEVLKSVSLPPEARADLESGDYLFGRGLFDMKTGDAILIAIMEHLSKAPKSLQGNLIYVAVCDEEANSKGMLAAIPKLLEIREEHQLNLLALLDTDYMTGEYPGDENKYVYIGTVGKIMPSFYIVGKETHVGEAFNGIDANQIAARLVDEVSLNPAYSDVVEGEAAMPPVTLKMRDLKTEYSVQTARTANVFFSYATHSSTPSEVLEKMKDAANKAFRGVVDTLNSHYATFSNLSGRKAKPLPFKARVLSYQDLLQLVIEEHKAKGKDFQDQLSRLIQTVQDHPTLDDREKSLKIVEFVYNAWSDREPIIIIYLTPPYYPHIYVTDEDPKGKLLLDTVKEVVNTTQSDYSLVFKKFFPFISDLSYGSAPKDPAVIRDLKENMPGFGVTYDLPLEEMQQLDLPVLDIGPYGKDAHQFTERIQTDYSFEVAPRLVLSTIQGLLVKK